MAVMLRRPCDAVMFTPRYYTGQSLSSPQTVAPLGPTFFICPTAGVLSELSGRTPEAHCLRTTSLCCPSSCSGNLLYSGERPQGEPTLPTP